MVAFFQVQLSVQPKEYGEAELILPAVLQTLNCQFVIVQAGGEEAIVKVEASEADLKKVADNKSCKKLTPSQLKSLKESYPAPKLKQKYRLPPTATEVEQGSEPFAISSSYPQGVDEQGNRLVDTWQTVRSGFYLIDVPVLTES